jgi:hypothetical protein
MLGDHLRAAETGSFAFLLPPPACRSDRTRRQFVHDAWPPLHDLCYQAALRCLRSEVATPTTCTGSSDAEDFAWSYGRGQLHQCVGDWLGARQIRYCWRICRPTDHPEDFSTLTLRLCTWA